MALLTKTRKKYLITSIILTIATFFNFKEIPIQETYVTIVQTCLYTMLGGFAFKTWLKR